MVTQSRLALIKNLPHTRIDTSDLSPVQVADAVGNEIGKLD
jgi:hypothetical protein